MQIALQDSEQNYRELVESSNSIIIRWNRSGEITFFNDFDLTDIKRFYVISNHNSPVTNHNQVRAWQGHKVEQKYFFNVKGAFLFVL